MVYVLKKEKIVFFCNNCGNEFSKWQGKCPSCGEWNSMVEEKVRNTNPKSPNKSSIIVEKSESKKLKEITVDKSYRMDTGLNELNRVLGGGLVLGSMVLIGGDPGIGKSTLLLQICNSLSNEGDVLYVTGEESAEQIKLRADRIGVTASNLSILAENDLANIEDVINKDNPKIIIVDSVQTIYRNELGSTPGSISQVREVTATFTYIAKQTGASIFLIGHVTKDGALAGPRVLEHLVDTVLYFEGDRYDSYRILRAVKNRFGSTNEIGVFEMQGEGFSEVDNPSGLFISENSTKESGCGISCILEGTRPVLIEMQALATLSSFNNARRMSNGIDTNRMTLLIAILEKKAGLELGKFDVYLNIVGGLKINERSSDLTTALIIASSLKNRPIQSDLVSIGELSLTGEIRTVTNIDKRITECQKLGFKKILIPAMNKKTLQKDYKDIEIIPVNNIKEALDIAII